jgi:membrane protein involved in colicin uptake
MGVTGWIIIAIVIVGIVAALLGWDRYRGSQKSAGGSAAQPTDEVFIDPDTGRKMRVWYDQRTGKRDYRPE